MIRAWKRSSAVLKAAVLWIAFVIAVCIGSFWVHKLWYLELALFPTYIAFVWGHMVGYGAGLKTHREIQSEVDELFNQITKGS